MDLSDRQKDIVSPGERETYEGAIYFGHLTAALSLYEEVFSLLAEWADFHADRNRREHGILGRPPLEQVIAELLPHRWKLIDVLYKDIVDNYQTYLERITKMALREAGRKANDRYTLEGAIAELRREFQIEPDQWDGRERWIRNLCARRDVLTHNRAMVNQRYLRKADPIQPPPLIGTELVLNESNLLEAAAILSDSVRHIEHEVIERLPSLDLTVSGDRRS